MRVRPYLRFSQPLSIYETRSLSANPSSYKLRHKCWPVTTVTHSRYRTSTTTWLAMDQMASSAIFAKGKLRPLNWVKASQDAIFAIMTAVAFAFLLLVLSLSHRFFLVLGLRQQALHTHLRRSLSIIPWYKLLLIWRMEFCRSWG